MTFLTVKEACETLKITRQTLYKYIKKGDIAAVRYGKTLRITSLTPSKKNDE